MAYLSEKVCCEVTHFIVPNDGDTTCWTSEGMFYGESGTTDTSSGPVCGCPVVAQAKCIVKSTFMECKAVSSDWKGSQPAVGTLVTGQISSSL